MSQRILHIQRKTLHASGLSTFVWMFYHNRPVTPVFWKHHGQKETRWRVLYDRCPSNCQWLLQKAMDLMTFHIFPILWCQYPLDTLYKVTENVKRSKMDYFVNAGQNALWHNAMLWNCLAALILIQIYCNSPLVNHIKHDVDNKATCYLMKAKQHSIQCSTSISIMFIRFVGLKLA